MATLVYPTPQQLRRIDQDFLPRTSQDSPIFGLFPIEFTNQPFVSWLQKDNYLGLMQMRGFNAPSPSVPRPGEKRYRMEPSAFGEYTGIDELEITMRAAPGSYDVPIDINDLVMEARDLLDSRLFNRVEWILWTLLSTGTFTVLDAKGSILARDSYAPQRFTASVTWSTVATATPFADLRAIQLLHRGRSVSFGSESMAFMNRTTWNSMSSNSNAADLGGKRAPGFQTITSQGDVNTLLTKDGLPNVVIYDEGYKDDTDTFQLWIPNNTVIVVGKRSNGARIGSFQMTRNAQNADLSGRPYTKIVDKGTAPDEPPPRKIEIHKGFSGGPCLEYPGGVVIMTV